MIKHSLAILKDLQYPTGLVAASKITVKTGYNLAWIRDNVYASLGFEATKSYTRLKQIYHALLDVLLKHEYKIDCAIKQKPAYHYQYIHARYDPLTMEEIWEAWGNKQNDAIGALLYKIGDLESKSIKIIRNNNDLRIIQKLVHYLASVEYWHDEDNGIWEEFEEIHSSSVGACVAGLKKISKLADVPKYLIRNGEKTLKKLLPRESKTKHVDMALLSLVYPYDVVSKQQAKTILNNVEKYLVRKKGVIRYIGDRYYYRNREAEWTMGFPWLAIIYKKLNKPDKYSYYMRKTLSVMNKNGELPELYFANAEHHNENSPLAWSQALYIVGQKAKFSV